MTGQQWDPEHHHEDPVGRAAVAHHSARLRAVLARAGRSTDPIVRLDVAPLAGSAVQALAAATDAVQALLDDAADRAERQRRAERPANTRPQGAHQP